MKKILFIIPFAFIGCKDSNTKPQTKSTDTARLVWGENLESTLPLASTDEWVDESGKPFSFNDTMQMDMEKIGIDYSNKKNGYKQREKIFNSIINGIKNGKLIAYKNYPDDLLTVNDVNRILVQWDSSAVIENPENPGEFISAPIKMEINSFLVSGIRFNETIEIDTISYSLTKKINYITILTYKRTEIGETIGQEKLFDVKLKN